MNDTAMKTLSNQELHTAETRPDLWDALADPDHPLNAAWPYFLDQDLTQKHFAEQICDFNGLRKFQSVIVERSETGEEELIACMRSIPFHWQELDQIGSIDHLVTHPHILQSLPDGGWDTMVARGIRQYMACHADERSSWPWPSPPIVTQDQIRDWEEIQATATERPNALCGLSITVRADRRRMGLAERMIEQMKNIARQEGLRVVVVPLRPTQKSQHPFVPMGEYVTWTQAPVKVTSQSVGSLNLAPSNSALPFDPWLRKHIRLGGKVAKVAPFSMMVEDDLTEWSQWTGIKFDSSLKGIKTWETDRETGLKRQCIQVLLKGGLAPLRVYVREQRAIYVEPNVWIYHRVE